VTARNDGTAFDLVVIGGGTAGMTVAKLAARAGQRVALVEADRTGGDCLYTGCVPSKSLLATARVLHQIRQAGDYGVAVGEPALDLARAMDRKEQIIDRIEEADSPAALTRAGVTVIRGAARFIGPRAVIVGERSIRGERFVIATGSRPAAPPIPGLAGAGYVTNVGLMELRRVPRRLAVIGGGPTGLELGQAFSRFGSEVTVVERTGRILGRDDAETAAFVQRRLEREGIAFRLGCQIVHAAQHAAAKRLTLGANDGGETTLDVDEILVATGRAPNVERLGLDAAGVAIGERGVVVDERLRTTAREIWACGDVVGPPFLTHAAEDQARAVAKNVLGGRAAWSGRAIPWATSPIPRSLASG
jgi:pyruvate/2-oxoglutarate dehydrogenase complex dihydrolipoamide dehydrogenase (E3) component